MIDEYVINYKDSGKYVSQKTIHKLSCSFAKKPTGNDNRWEGPYKSLEEAENEANIGHKYCDNLRFCKHCLS